ncbi:hypothetical protein [Streptomyces albus]|uniref:hypothetical protein n=1 Tax=Streptomyces sp. NRRL F-5917 TaxID=1463873 RepID=UPI0004C250D9|nr:hypothetical protein [Streptomyces sp. NRRL F-5917]
MTDHDPVGELTRLVRDAQQAGDSYQRLADRAIDPITGSQLSKPYLQKLGAGDITAPPRAYILRAIAAALRKPEAVVQRAAARQFFEYEATELSGYDDDTRVIVAHLAGMDPAERRTWRAMVEAAEQAKKE